MDDPFIWNYVEDLLKKIRTQVALGTFSLRHSILELVANYQAKAFPRL